MHTTYSIYELTKIVNLHTKYERVFSGVNPLGMHTTVCIHSTSLALGYHDYRELVEEG